MLNNVLNNIKFDSKFSWQLCLVFCLLSMVVVGGEALADTSSSDAISSVLCAIVGKLTGQMGRGIATIAIVVLGIGLFLGKLSWAVAVATGIGIGLIFGAGQMVAWLGSAGAGTTGTAPGATC
jgi:type IV secretion system protein VirB2